MSKTIVHIVGTGTIGEPLIGLFTDFSDRLGFDEGTFHTRSALAADRPKIAHLMQRGAKLAAEPEVREKFEKLGHVVTYDAQEALERATVVIDCTPAGNDNKARYLKLTNAKGFLAPGSGEGFGKPSARGVNDEALVPGEDRFVQIVSCNTHNITTLIRTVCEEGDGELSLERGTFVCMRRANDITQSDDFVAAPTVGKHDDPEFGTHHAHDANRVFRTLGKDLKLWSSAVKLNTQYMHSLWFNLNLDRDITLEEVVRRLRDNARVAVTDKKAANLIFSFGRDHGYYARILSRPVAVLPALPVRDPREVYGFCFTPQDGNSLLSSIAAALWLVDPEQESVARRLEPLRRWLYREI